MFLQQLEIKNYRSLEHVELDGLDRFSVLIGRNNSGKSSVFGALALLNALLRGVSLDFTTILPAGDVERKLEIRLLFKLLQQERVELISLTRQENQGNQQLIDSPLYRQIEYSFSTEQGGSNLALRELRIRSQNNKWGTIFKTLDNAAGEQPEGKFVPLRETYSIANNLDSHVFDVPNSQFSAPIEYRRSLITSTTALDPATGWIFRRLGHYLNRAYFFNPFRHSNAKMPASQNEQLAQDGSNLAQVLHTINSNDRSLFDRIEQFIHAALPDVGRLQTPLTGSETEISFRSRIGNFPVRLQDMGGGVEQLLMIATVLLTTSDESTLFLEEPESHLHAGAQRFLIEKLYEGERQVFITTHSPTFINSPQPMVIHQVKYIDNKTVITQVNSSDLLGGALNDIGSRNSDVLLSDSVLFVEGPGDKDVFEEWGETIGHSLEEHNITVIPMGGSEEAARGARARSDVLIGISQKSPVPHLFVLDRDERSKAEVLNLTGQLDDRVHLLERRELENYLLVPRALLAAIRDKHKSDAVVMERIDSATAEEVMSIIKAKADGLFELVLVKRIRAEIGGLRGGLIPRDMVATLALAVNHKSFSRVVRRAIGARLSTHLGDLNVDKIIKSERVRLKREWNIQRDHLSLAPGEEIVSAVFHHFGSEYKKPTDTVRIAKAMTAEDIPDEIRTLIQRIISISNNAET